MSKLSVLLKNAVLSSIVFLSFAVTSQEIEEVVVTATKKAESIQDLALSIEAVNAELLTKIKSMTYLTLLKLLQVLKHQKLLVLVLDGL